MKHGKTHRLTGITGMLLLSAALLTPSGAGAQFAATIERDQENNLQVSWSDPSPNDGYAVFTSPDLTTGWHYAGDVDQWPSATNSWPVTTPDSSAFFKVQKTDRGHLISAEYLNSQSAWQVNLALLLLGVSGISADYPVDVFKLTYETFDARGQSTIASGAVCIPNGPATAPLASYQHGTVYLRSDAPSNSDADEQFLGVVFASLGYIVTMPDYLGLGPSAPMTARADGAAPPRNICPMLPQDLSLWRPEPRRSADRLRRFQLSRTTQGLAACLCWVAVLIVP